MKNQARIAELLNGLMQQAKAIDHKNLRHQESVLWRVEFFDDHLFDTDGRRLAEYVSETQSVFQRLLAQPVTARHQRGYLAQKLDDQLQALSKIVGHFDLVEKRIKEAKQPKKQREQHNKYQQMAKRVMQSSHELHQNLAQNHEFERRLTDMVFSRVQQLQHASPEQHAQLNAEITALQGRLSRCRKAIKHVEEQIDWLAKRGG